MWELILFSTLNQQVLNPTKLAYELTSHGLSPARSVCQKAELAISFLAVDMIITSTHCASQRHGHAELFRGTFHK